MISPQALDEATDALLFYEQQKIGSWEKIYRFTHRFIFIMPTILKIGSYRFHFYSDEGEEPPHIHVATPEGECKFWLDPVRLARNKGVHPKTLRSLEKMVFENLMLLKEKFNEIHCR